MRKAVKQNNMHEIAHINKSRLFSILFALVVFALIFKGVMQVPQIVENKERAKTLTEQIEYEKERQREIDELKAKVNTDEYIEKAATEKLGLVKKNAKIFVDISSEEE